MEAIKSVAEGVEDQRVMSSRREAWILFKQVGHEALAGFVSFSRPATSLTQKYVPSLFP